MRHTIVIEVADEPSAGRRPRTSDEIEKGLTNHIERWAGWPVEVIEYHHEQMTST